MNSVQRLNKIQVLLSTMLIKMNEISDNLSNISSDVNDMIENLERFHERFEKQNKSFDILKAEISKSRP